MVYILRELGTVPGKELSLGVNGIYNIGRRRRKGNDIIIDDKTISKSHAVLEIKNGSVSIEDLESKRGTFVNHLKITKPTPLKDGDIIQFGIQNSKFCFIDPKWITQLDGNIIDSTKTSLKAALDELGIEYLECYDNCTHFTTDIISLQSVKEQHVLLALIDRKTIVTSDFWLDLLQRSKFGSEIPDASKYAPTVDRCLKLKGVNSIGSNLARRFLLEGKLLIYFDKKSQQDTFNIVEKCGGTWLLYNRSKEFSEKLKSLGPMDYILVENSLNIKASLQMQQFYKESKICKKMCCVTVIDIYISILTVSLENYTRIRKTLHSRKTRLNSSTISSTEVMEIIDEGESENDEDVAQSNDTDDSRVSNLNTWINKSGNIVESTSKTNDVSETNTGQIFNKKQNNNQNSSVNKNFRKNIKHYIVLNKESSDQASLCREKNNIKDPLTYWKRKYPDLAITEKF